MPVLLYEQAREADIPSILGGYTLFKLAAFGLEDAQSQYSKLYRLLTRQPAKLMTEVGPLQKLPPLPQEARRTDFILLIQEAIASIKKTESNTEEILAILKGRAVPTSTAQRPHNLPPWMRSDCFIGRGEELQKLISGLTKSGKDAVAQPQVVHGGGGTGKSRLAIQVAWLLYVQGKCEMAFFVSADTPSMLDTKLVELDGRSFLNLYKDVEPPKELDARKKNVIDALRAQAGRWVLVLDNADSKEACDAIKQLLSSLAGGRFLVASRRENWPTSTVRKLRLDVFNPSEAVSCLRSRYWKTDPTVQEKADFKRLAHELGYLPLGLTLASSYMRRNAFTPGRYLEKWEQEQQKLLNFVGDDDERSVIGAFNVSYGQLSSEAVVLLQHLAWLAPAPLPRRSVEDSQYLSNALTADISDVLADLQALSIIERDENSISVHRLVLSCARALMSEETRRDSLSSVLEWLDSILPMAGYEPEGWKLWVGLSPHLDSTVEASETLQMESPSLARICGSYGLWHYYQARFSLAEPLMRRALDIDEKSYGPQHPEVARDLNNLALLLQATNRLSEAEPLMRRALDIDEKSYGPQHPDVAIRLNNLAQLLQATNRLSEAGPLFERCVVSHLKFCLLTGHLHPNLRTVFENYLGFLTKMALSGDEISKRVWALGAEAGFDDEGYQRVLEQVLT